MKQMTNFTSSKVNTFFINTKFEILTKVLWIGDICKNYIEYVQQP
jgi:hypothetical protein